jgi:hypothetical protein
MNTPFVYIFFVPFPHSMPEKKESILSVVHPDNLIVVKDEYTQVDDKEESIINRNNDVVIVANVHDDVVNVDAKGDAKGNTKDPDPDILSENKVNVEIVPDVKSNQVMVQLCSMSLFCCLWTTGK